MASESRTAPDPTDLAVVRRFAALTGMEAQTLVHLAVAALAEHIRQHGSLQLPVRIGPPSPLCAHCPLARVIHSAPPTDNILTGPW